MDYIVLDMEWNQPFSAKHMVKTPVLLHGEVVQIGAVKLDENYQYGFPFPVAMNHFQKWCGEKFVFFTWGSDDSGMLRDNMILHGLNTDWLPKTYDIQMIFDDQITKEKRRISLSSAVEIIGEPAFDAHDALNDARSTACVCWHLDMARGLSGYAELQKQMETYWNLAAERNRSAKAYSTKESALGDPELVYF